MRRSQERLPKRPKKGVEVLSNLIVKISGDSKQLASEYKKVAKQTQDLENQIAATTKVAAAAFVGFTAAIAGTVAQYRVQEQAELRLQQTLKATQGAAGLTAKEIINMAGALQEVTTFGDEAIISGQNMLLTFKNIGGDIFPRVTEAMLDMSTAMGTDLKASAIQMGKALNDPIKGMATLSRVGVAFTDQQKEMITTLQKSGDIAGAQNVILKELEGQFGGVAKAAAGGTGSMIQLSNAWGDFLEDVGKHFVPFLSTVAKGLSDVIGWMRENEAVARLAAKVLALGAGLSALVTGLGLAALAFFKIRTAMIASKIATQGMGLAVKGLVGATGIGLLVIVASEILLNWDSIWTKAKDIYASFSEETIDRIQLFTTIFAPPLGAIIFFARNWEEIWTTSKDIFFFFFDSTIKWIAVLKTAFTSFGNFMSRIGDSLATIMEGALLFDFARMKEGLERLKTELVDGVGNIRDEIQEEMQKQDNLIEIKAIARKKEDIGDGLVAKDEAKDDSAEKTKIAEEKKTAAVNAETQKRIAALKNEQTLLKAARDGQTQEEIDFIGRKQALRLEEQEANTIKDEEERAVALENVRLKNEELLMEQTEFTDRRRELEAEIREGDLELSTELDELAKESRTQKQAEELAELKNSLLTKKEAEDSVRKEKIKTDIETRNTFLKDTVKHGTAIATINKALGSDEVKGVEKANSQLVQLSQSKNNTLKSIGKAAAVSQIAIDTAKGAVAAYTSLVGIPIVGPVLAPIAAGAVIAFGVEKTASVLGANRGGRVPSNLGIPGQDSVPASLTPGELITPDQNFEEVVGSVAATRAAKSQGMMGGGNIENLLGQILSKTGGGGTIINGDILADETFIDRLIDGINTATEERNATLSATNLV